VLDEAVVDGLPGKELPEVHWWNKHFQGQGGCVVTAGREFSVRSADYFDNF
jgi:hypothetical protein